VISDCQLPIGDLKGNTLRFHMFAPTLARLFAAMFDKSAIGNLKSAIE